MPRKRSKKSASKPVKRQPEKKRWWQRPTIVLGILSLFTVIVTATVTLFLTSPLLLPIISSPRVIVTDVLKGIDGRGADKIKIQNLGGQGVTNVVLGYSVPQLSNSKCGPGSWKEEILASSSIRFTDTGTTIELPVSPGKRELDLRYDYTFQPATESTVQTKSWIPFQDAEETDCRNKWMDYPQLQYLTTEQTNGEIVFKRELTGPSQTRILKKDGQDWISVKTIVIKEENLFPDLKGAELANHYLLFLALRPLKRPGVPLALSSVALHGITIQLAAELLGYSGAWQPQIIDRKRDNTVIAPAQKGEYLLMPLPRNGVDAWPWSTQGDTLSLLQPATLTLYEPNGDIELATDEVVEGYVELMNRYGGMVPPGNYPIYITIWAREKFAPDGGPDQSDPQDSVFMLDTAIVAK